MAASILLSGCSGGVEFVPVRGRLQSDGLPLADVLVTFVPDYDGGAAPPVSRGTTDAAGYFELLADDGRVGAAVGSHRVVLEDLLPFRAPRNEKPGTPRPPPPRLDPQYASAGDTPLRQEVNAAALSPTIDVPLRAGRSQR